MSDFVLRSMVKAKRVYSFDRHEYVVPVYDIDNIPSHNVKMNVKGKWKLLDGGKGQCSECQSVFKDVWDYDKSDSFCRVCGADMREEEK